MKKIFNHTKRPYRKWDEYMTNSDDWDEVAEEEYYEQNENESYYVEENGEEYYTEAYEEEVAEVGNYYVEENGEEYYTESYGEEVAEAGNYYAEENGEEYYTEAYEEEVAEIGNYYVEESVEEYYIESYEEEVAGTGNYYVNENGEEYYTEAYEKEAAETGNYYVNENAEEYYIENYEEEVAATSTYYTESPKVGVNHTRKNAPAIKKGRSGKSSGTVSTWWTKLLHMDVMDRLVTTTGVAVLILALITGGVYMSGKMIDKQLSEFTSVGSQIADIEMIGEKGLVAVADAQMAKKAAAAIVEEEAEEQKDYNEAEYNKNAVVKLEMVSVQKDLKIKFTNNESGKLIANVPFSVTITDPNGKTATWSDDDMDGIIYKKGITPGNYKVLANELTDDKYEKYILAAITETVEVKKDISYKKVDVKNEVKKESEVNVAKEDTKKKETKVESSLEDTVTWIDSSTTEITFIEVAKNTIPDPAATNQGTQVLHMSNSSVSQGDAASVSLAVGAQATMKAPTNGFTEGSELTYGVYSNRTDIATASVDGAGNITISGVAEGDAVVTVIVNYAGGDDSTAVPTNISVKVNGSANSTTDNNAVTVYLTVPFTINGAKENTTAESSDTNVATVAVNNQAITITGVSAGSAVITIKYSENGTEMTATYTVTVKEHPKDDKTSKLKDANGNQLYITANNLYREAVYADYYTETQFFKKGDAKYTGWQTIDGKVYFFDVAGEKVTGEQIIQGAKYNFASDGILITDSGTLGIDVSKWNGRIDWTAVKNSGISYVIIRCGYRGSSQGALIEDSNFKTNIQGATAAGLKVGVYFFTQAVDEIEAVEEASMVLDYISGYRISYPVFLDVEPSGGRGDAIDKATRTAVCKAFCKTIQDAGYTAGIYANKTWLTTKIDTGALSSYKIWLAQYAATPTYTGKYDMWQYKDTGKVSGISGDVDLNLSYLGY